VKDNLVLKVRDATYELREWNGRNESGYKPVCDKVLVLPDKSMSRTSGGIEMPETTQDRQGVAAVTGVVIEVGPQAFAYDGDRLTRWEGWRPQPGDRVCFERYAGQEYPGLDGEVYRIMQDRSIGGVLGVPAALKQAEAA